MAEPAPLDLIEGVQRARAVLRAPRLEILERLREPDSAAGVARALGLPRQRVTYHVRELEKQGLLRVVGERRRGNFVERLVQATARHYLIAPQALGALGVRPDAIRDRFSSAYLIAVSAQTIREVSELRERARAAGKRLPTLTLETEVRFATAADQHAFAEALTNFVAELAARYHDADAENGRTFRFTIGGHPASGRSGDQGSTADVARSEGEVDDAASATSTEIANARAR